MLKIMIVIIIMIIIVIIISSSNDNDNDNDNYNDNIITIISIIMIITTTTTTTTTTIFVLLIIIIIIRKGTNGVSTNGVTANFMFFGRGTFWVLPLAYFYLPKSARACLFPQSVKVHYFRSGPISVDPICPQIKARSRTSRATSATRIRGNH